MTTQAWGRVLRHTPDFPDRLDDEFSFLSIRKILPFCTMAPCNDDRLTSARIVFRREYPRRTLSTSHMSVFVRIEVFDLPDGISARKEVPIRQDFIHIITSEAVRAGLSAAIPSFVCTHDLLAPDPGDLSGHLVLDADLWGASIHNIAKASNHKLLSLSGSTDIELLRMPAETDQ